MTHDIEHFYIPIYVGHLYFFWEVLLRPFAHFFIKTTLCYFVDGKVLELVMYSRYESFAKRTLGKQCLLPCMLSPSLSIVCFVEASEFGEILVLFCVFPQFGDPIQQIILSIYKYVCVCLSVFFVLFVSR